MGSELTSRVRRRFALPAGAALDSTLSAFDAVERFAWTAVGRWEDEADWIIAHLRELGAAEDDSPDAAGDATASAAGERERSSRSAQRAIDESLPPGARHRDRDHLRGGGDARFARAGDTQSGEAPRGRASTPVPATAAGATDRMSPLPIARDAEVRSAGASDSDLYRSRAPGATAGAGIERARRAARERAIDVANARDATDGESVEPEPSLEDEFELLDRVFGPLDLAPRPSDAPRPAHAVRAASGWPASLGERAAGAEGARFDAAERGIERSPAGAIPPPAPAEPVDWTAVRRAADEAWKRRGF